MTGLDLLVLELEQEGYERGTAEFAKAMRLRKLEKCREQRGMVTCFERDQQFFCRLIEEHRRARLEEAKQSEVELVREEEKRAEGAHRVVSISDHTRRKA